MAANHDAAAAERVEAVLSLVATRADPRERAHLEEFSRAYLAGLDAEDVIERDALDLYGAVRSLWQVAATRAPGEAKVRVFNPSVDEQGWQSPHTVVEIVNDDMPFLVDSVQMEVLRQGLAVNLIAHPIVTVQRDAGGRLAGLARDGERDGVRESLMHVEVERVADAARRSALAADLARVLADVRTVVGDWTPMRAKMLEVMADLERNAPPLPPDDVAETREFLAWLADAHFTYVGYRCHDLVEREEGVGLAIVPGSGLGILRDRAGETHSASFGQLPPALREQAKTRDLVIITKSNSRSTVHRPGYLDYIGIKRYDAAGNVCGEHRFLGLYTSMAYSAKPTDIPLLRRKVGRVLEQAGFPPQSHSAKSLTNILATYPRDELFQVSEGDLARTVLGILKLEGRQRFRVFLRHDLYERFVSCLIYAPRERYTTELRRKWQAILVDAFGGTGSEFAVLLSESSLVRVLVTVRTQPGRIPAYDAEELERRLAAASRRWEDDLAEALDRSLGEGQGGPLYHRYAYAFPAAYREDFPARSAVPDIALVESALATGRVAINLYRPVDAAPSALRFKLVHRGGPVPLSNALPMLERMGLTVIEERPYRVSPAGAERVWVHDYGLVLPDAEVDHEEARGLFEDAFLRVFEGTVENDGFNRLVLAARLSADEVVVLRAYGRYLRQLGFPLSQAFIEQTLAAHPGIARMLVALFRARFDPAAADDDLARRQAGAIRTALEKVTNLSEDRVLRQYVALIEATLRTSFWRVDGEGRRRPYLSFKLDPAQVPGMPAPAPLFEIWVYAPRFEGVHLRGGKVVARRPALVGPPRGLPHRGAGPRQGADGEEHRDRAGGLEGRLRAEARAVARRPRRVPEGGHRLLPGLPAGAARPHRQPPGRGDRAAARRQAPRPRRPVPRRRRGQGHRGVLGSRERGVRGVRLLARRRLRLRRFGGLRPQGHGHHRARRLGGGEAPLPRGGRRHAGAGLHRGRHRRHVGRRVRQRHAAVPAHPARRGVRPPPRLRRPGAGHRGVARRAPAPVRPAAQQLGGLRREADQPRRRRVAARGQVDPRLARGPRGARPRRRRDGAPAERARERDPARPRGPALQRRHRHLRQGLRRDARGGRRPRQRRAAHRRDGTALQGRRRGRQPRLHAARAHRVRARRRAHQHRRDRQLGRRRHLRPRGEHQDPARPAGRRGGAHHQAEERVPRDA